MPPADEEQWAKIRIKHLLNMRAGFKSEAGADHFQAQAAAKAVNEAREKKGLPPRWNTSFPLDAELMASYIAGLPGNFVDSPGSYYSNYSYDLLGLAIARKSGLSYDQFVTDRIFRRAGIPSAPGLPDVARARHVPPDPFDKEIRYHMGRPEVIARINKEPPHLTTWPYGMTLLPGLPSGGWSMAPVDVVRVLAVLNATRELPPSQQLISQELRDNYLWAPDARGGFKSVSGWGLQTTVQQTTGVGTTINVVGSSFGGGAAGAGYFWFTRFSDRLCVAFGHNTSFYDTFHGGSPAATKSPTSKDLSNLTRNIREIADEATQKGSWPNHDLWTEVGMAQLPEMPP